MYSFDDELKEHVLQIGLATISGFLAPILRLKTKLHISTSYNLHSLDTSSWI